jgi:hypothetical protein
MNIDDRILDTIEKARKIERLSHNKRHLSDVIYQSPDKQFRYYWVRVWEIMTTPLLLILIFM